MPADPPRDGADDGATAMNLTAILTYPFDWRGVLSRGDYRRNISILFLAGALITQASVSSLKLIPGQGFRAISVAVGLSFDARGAITISRRSAAWIIWANLIAAALAIVVFEFIPNALDYVPLPE